jgi:hypothetical protein
MLIEHQRQGLDHFLHGLVELRFARILGLDLSHQCGNVVFHFEFLANALRLKAARLVLRLCGPDEHGRFACAVHIAEVRKTFFMNAVERILDAKPNRSKIFDLRRRRSIIAPSNPVAARVADASAGETSAA